MSTKKLKICDNCKKEVDTDYFGADIDWIKVEYCSLARTMGVADSHDFCCKKCLLEHFKAD